jgi:hypothetical protein
MPRDSATGKFVLESVKREQLALQAARTAQAVARCVGPPDGIDLSQGSSSVPPVQRESIFTPGISFQGTDEPWERHVFSAGKLVVFSRGRSECITIRKAPVGEGWLIDLGDPPTNSGLPE